MKTTLFKSFMALVACLFVSTAWAQSEGDEVTYDIPTPATIVEKDLNVVGTSEVLVEQYARADYTADALELDINEVMTKLGIASLEEFAAILPDILYCTEYFMGDEAYPGGPKLDTLSNYVSDPIFSVVTGRSAVELGDSFMVLQSSSPDWRTKIG